MVFRANLKARYSGGAWRGGGGGGGQAQSCGGIMVPCGRRDHCARGGWHTTYAWRLVGLVSSAVEDKNHKAVQGAGACLDASSGSTGFLVAVTSVNWPVERVTVVR